MIDFPRSTFTWTSHPWASDPYYRYTGGFVGTPGEVYIVRFNVEAKCELRDETSGAAAEIFVGAPCRTEYTIAHDNLFQIPSSEFRMAFSRTARIPIAKRPSDEPETNSATPLSEAFDGHAIDIRNFDGVTELDSADAIADATVSNRIMGARCTYRDAARGISVAVEFPVNLINLNRDPPQFQICTGPVILPDLATWSDGEVGRVFLAHVALTRFDAVEFILQREVEVAPEEAVWLDRVRGRDRRELLDPNNVPPGHPPRRARPTVYNETWELESTNEIWSANGT
jgi:hypothetical protein